MSIWDQVVEDMKKRDQFGLRKYGKHLGTHDGRDSMAEAYAEALDQCVYLKKMLIERVDLQAAVELLKSFPSHRSPELEDWIRDRNAFLGMLMQQPP